MSLTRLSIKKWSQYNLRWLRRQKNICSQPARSQGRRVQCSTRFRVRKGLRRIVLGARCGESRSPVLSPGSKEPRRETGPTAMGHPRGEAAWALRSRCRRWGASARVHSIGPRPLGGGIQCRMCFHQMIRKRRCLGAVVRVVSCTPQALRRCHLQCPRCNSSAHYSLQHQQGQSVSRRQRRGRDGQPVYAAHEPLHACRASAKHWRDAKCTVHPIAGVEKDPVLHCLVHLREPTRRRCIQLRREYLEQLVGQRDGPHTGSVSQAATATYW